MSKACKQAEQLIQEGKLDEATKVLMEALHAHPEDKDLHSDAVSVFLYGEMYREAQQVFHLYQTQTGRILEGDHSLEEVKCLAGNAFAGSDQLAQAGVKVFKQMSLRESLNQRGHLIGWGALPFINEVRLSPDGFGVRRWGKDYTYLWSDITSATLTRKPIRTEYQNFLGKKLCVKARGKIVFNRDSTLYQHADVLLFELKKYCQVDEINRKERRVPLWMWIFLFVAVIVVSRWLRQAGFK